MNRYPAKMVSRLAETLVDRYASEGATVFDPFCGSGELLVSAARRNLQVSGCDINPYAVLLARVRIEGFSQLRAEKLLTRFLERASRATQKFEMRLPRKEFWYSAGAMAKLERLRQAALDLDLTANKEGRSILLALAMSARLCSRADERSPKPYISKRARKHKYGRHIDPIRKVANLHSTIARMYGRVRKAPGTIRLCDWASKNSRESSRYSLVVTSPPYLNAQDYFRNFKLELYLLEGIVDFAVEDIAHKFVGTERGLSQVKLGAESLRQNRAVVPELRMLEEKSAWHAAVVHRYFCDMRAAFHNIGRSLKANGRFILVCGDNLIASRRIRTWACLREILLGMGWKEVDHFADRIRNRALAPQRAGHRGLIKEERVLVFARSRHLARASKN